MRMARQQRPEHGREYGDRGTAGRGVYAEGCSVCLCVQPRRSVILMVWTTRERCGERASPTCGAVAWRGAFFIFAGAFLPGPLYPAPLR